MITFLSYFASTLVGRLLKKITRSRSYKELYAPTPDDIETSLKTVLAELFKELNLARNLLTLDQKDLLTTLIILLYHKEKDHGLIMAIGDGLVNINSVTTEFDQDNKPDYLGFHLNKDFDNWYKAQTQKIAFTGLSDVSIATDGITTFERIAHRAAEEDIDPMTFILTDRAGEDDEDMLYLKLKRLEHVYGLKPTDDLALIRLINS